MTKEQEKVYLFYLTLTLRIKHDFVIVDLNDMHGRELIVKEHAFPLLNVGIKHLWKNIEPRTFDDLISDPDLGYNHYKSLLKDKATI